MIKNRFIALFLSFALFTSLLPAFAEAENANMGEKEFLNSHGRLGVYPELVPKEGVARWASLEGETNERIHLHRVHSDVNYANGGDVYFNLNLQNKVDVKNYVFEIDVYPVSVSRYSLYTLLNIMSDNGSTPLVMVNGNKLVSSADDNAESYAILPEKEWSTVSVVANVTDDGKLEYDLYFNREIVKQGLTKNRVIMPNKLRIGINAGRHEAEIYLDNIRLYEGTEITKSLPQLVSYSETNEEAQNIIGNSSVFMTKSDTVYMDGKKMSYSALGYKRFMLNNVFYVSTNAAIKALNCAEIDLESIIITKDGLEYVPVISACELMRKYCYSDDRGWILISDSSISLSNSIVSREVNEKSDIIDRFMQFERPSGDEVYNLMVSNSYQKHPRLFITSDEITQLKSDIQTNAFKRKGADAVLTMADTLLSVGPVEYRLQDGLRLFDACLDVRDRLVTLTTAFIVTDDISKKRVYADRIWDEVENACNWKDWNVEKHYLDSGKIGPGIALAYDVCYNYFTKEQKAFIRKSLCEKYLYYAQNSYAGLTDSHSIGKNTTNWGAVCNGSVLLICLATMDEEDAASEYTNLTKFLVQEALRGLEYSIVSTYPHGAWDEGVGYFRYVLEYLSWSANALRNTCGNDFGIMSYPGVSDMPFYAMYIQTAKNGTFNFGDGATMTIFNQTCPEVFLMARLLSDSEMNDMWYNFKFKLLDTSLYTTYGVRDFLFYTPGSTADNSYTDFPLDSVFGNVEVGVMKSGWENDDIYLASVGGRVLSHFDKGSFVFEALGERWAIDLGQDDYNIDGGYTGLLGADIYRKRAEGHNTLVINPDEDAGQIFNADAYITDTAYGKNEAYTVYDLTNVYADDASSVKRGFFLGDMRSTLTIQDEISLKSDGSSVNWFMHTNADIEIANDGKSALLTQNGKKLRVDFVTNLSNWNVTKMAAEPLEVVREGQAANDGVSKIRFAGSGSGDVYITAKLSPVIEDKEYPAASYLSIDEWSVDEYMAEIFDVDFDSVKKELSFTARSRSEKDYKVFVAAYNEDELIALTEITFDGSRKKEDNILSNLNIPQGCTDIKCFFWDKEKIMIPLTAAIPYKTK